jgi:hypothetical protein
MPHRVTFEVTDEQYQKLRKHLDYGFLKKVYTAMTDDMLQIVEKGGYRSVVAIADGRIKLDGDPLRSESERTRDNRAS